MPYLHSYRRLQIEAIGYLYVSMKISHLTLNAELGRESWWGKYKCREEERSSSAFFFPCWTLRMEIIDTLFQQSRLFWSFSMLMRFLVVHSLQRAAWCRNYCRDKIVGGPLELHCLLVYIGIDIQAVRWFGIQAHFDHHEDLFQEVFNAGQCWSSAATWAREEELQQLAQDFDKLLLLFGLANNRLRFDRLGASCGSWFHEPYQDNCGAGDGESVVWPHAWVHEEWQQWDRWPHG